MQTATRLIAAITLVTLTGCSETGAREADSAASDQALSGASAREAIEAANARFVDALLRGDVAGMSANYADGAVIMMPGDAAWTGRTTIEGKFRELLDGTTFTAARFATEDVLVGGDLAVERGAGTWTYTPKGGKPVTDRLKYLAVWRRQPDGSLRIIRDINNSDGPAGQ
jgi:uncharacterized protein (TIGR02246 family)